MPIIRDAVALRAARWDVSRMISGSSATSGACVRKISSLQVTIPPFGLARVVEAGVDDAAGDGGHTAWRVASHIRNETPLRRHLPTT